MCSTFYPGEIFLENASCYRVIALHTRRSVCVLPNLVKLLPGKPIGVNISEGKSGTERTKKRKKGELVWFPHRQGAQRSSSPIYISAIHGFCLRVTITRDIFIPSHTQCGLSRSLTNRQSRDLHNILQV